MHDLLLLHQQFYLQNLVSLDFSEEKVPDRIHIELTIDVAMAKSQSKPVSPWCSTVIVLVPNFDKVVFPSILKNEFALVHSR